MEASYLNSGRIGQGELEEAAKRSEKILARKLSRRSILAAFLFTIIFIFISMVKSANVYPYAPAFPQPQPSISDDCGCPNGVVLNFDFLEPKGTAVFTFFPNGDMFITFSGGNKGLVKKKNLPPEWGEKERSIIQDKEIQYTVETYRSKNNKAEKALRLFSEDPKVQKVLNYLE